MEPSRDDNLRMLRGIVRAAPSVAIAQAVEVSWTPGSSEGGVDTHVKLRCIHQVSGPTLPPSVVIPSSTADQQQVFHLLVMTDPESYLVGLDGPTLLFALEVELDGNGHYKLVNGLWGVQLADLIRMP